MHLYYIIMIPSQPSSALFPAVLLQARTLTITPPMWLPVSMQMFPHLSTIVPLALLKAHPSDTYYLHDISYKEEIKSMLIIIK
jgi:hypothetical protein